MIEDQLIHHSDVCNRCASIASTHTTKQDSCMFRILHSELQNRNETNNVCKLAKSFKYADFVLYKDLL